MVEQTSMSPERQNLNIPFTYVLIALLVFTGPVAYPCSQLFRELIRNVHRPAFEWSEQIPHEGVPFELARAQGYQYLAKIANRPLPRIDRKRRDTALRTVDAFFDEVIRGYPESTQQRLRSIYYNGVGHAYTPDLFVQSQNLANWHLREKNKLADFTVEFDQALQSAELIKKMILIHECAVHIGQIDQRLGQVGPSQLMTEHNSKDPYLFTEMSAALAEKTLLSAMDFSVIEAEAGEILDPVVRLGVLGQMFVARQLKLQNYVELIHRGEPVPPTAAQVQQFLKRP